MMSSHTVTSPPSSNNHPSHNLHHHSNTSSSASSSGGVSATTTASSKPLLQQSPNNTSHFHSKIPVHVKHPNREAYSTPLTIQISTRQKSKQSIIPNARQVLQKDHYNGIVNMNMKCLEVCLTDEDDLFFLYYLQLTEEEFTHLKAQLNLYIEYNHFHQHLIEMLNLCIQCQNSENPEYMIHLDINGTDAQFSVIQKTQFRQLTHLPLYFKSGNDQQLKDYLASEIKSYKEQNAHLKHELDHAKESSSRTIQSLQEAHNELSQKFDSLQRESSQSSSSLRMSHSNEITALKEKHMQTVQEMQAKFDAERKSTEESYTTEIKTLTLKNEQLTVQSNSLSTEKFKLESKVRELESKLESLREEHQSNMKELVELRGQNKSLDTIKFTNEKNLSKNQMELVALRQQIKDKDIHLENLQKLQESAVEQKSLLTSEVESLKNALKSTSDKYKQAVNEIRKGNDIIQRLQIQIKQEKYKAKRKKQLMQQMDNKIKTLEQDKIHLEHQISNAKNTEKNLQDDIDNLKAQIEGKKQEVKSHLDQMKRLQLVNDSLSHKLNDSHQMRGMTRGMYGGASAAKRGSSFVSGIGSFMGASFANTRHGGAGVSSIGGGSTAHQDGGNSGDKNTAMDQSSRYTYQSSIMRGGDTSQMQRPPFPGGAQGMGRSGYQRITPTIPSGGDGNRQQSSYIAGGGRTRYSSSEYTQQNTTGTEASTNAGRPLQTSGQQEQQQRNSPQKSWNKPPIGGSGAGSSNSARPESARPTTTSTSNFVSFNPSALNSSKFHE